MPAVYFKRSLLGFACFLPLYLGAARGAEQPFSPARDLPTSSSEIKPLSIGDPIPALSLRNARGEKVNLNNLISQKPTVLIFYRGGWCPYCDLQLGKLYELQGDLFTLGYQIIAISPDKPEKLQESIEKHKIGYLLLSDSDLEAARAFGVAYKLSRENLRRLKIEGVDLKEATGKNNAALPVRSAFVIGEDEVVRFRYVSPNYKLQMDSGFLLYAAKSALHGEEGRSPALSEAP